MLDHFYLFYSYNIVYDLSLQRLYLFLSRIPLHHIIFDGRRLRYPYV